MIRSIRPMRNRPAQPIIRSMLLTGSTVVDAERAFTRAARARRRAAVLSRLRHRPADRAALEVYDERAAAAARRQAAGRGVREIPVDAITGTFEAGKASLFDREFRPGRAARPRWERVWVAEHRGAVLPPISVVQVGDRFVVRDGHHRVSVARARGAATIDAVLEPAA